jgi:hypothetical protein
MHKNVSCNATQFWFFDDALAQAGWVHLTPNLNDKTDKCFNFNTMLAYYHGINTSSSEEMPDVVVSESVYPYPSAQPTTIAESVAALLGLGSVASSLVIDN